MNNLDGAYAGLQKFADITGNLGVAAPPAARVERAVKLRNLAAVVERAFTAEDWAAVAQFVTKPSVIEEHPRLYRSLHFGDDDYGWCVQDVLQQLDAESPANIDAIEAYLDGVTRQNGASEVGERVLVEGESVRFRCDRDLTFVRELGHGGTGRTMLFRDETANLLFAMKKFDPRGGNDPEDCYRRFVDEAAILLRVSHPHVVRVFGYYLYPQASTGYIQMEFIEGVPLDKFLPGEGTKSPAEIFSDAVSAFGALEVAGVLHRDVKAANLLVTGAGDVKLIDFGFGKSYEGESTLENNSILVRMPEDTPLEVASFRYDRATEVYYVGKLFERALAAWGVPMAEFPYAHVVARMTPRDPSLRLKSFSEVREAMAPSDLAPADFTEGQLAVCRALLDAVSAALANVDSLASPVGSASVVVRRLDKLLSSCGLEREIPDPSLLLSCVIDGKFSFWPVNRPAVSVIRDFRNLLAGLAPDLQLVVMKNLGLRIGLAPRIEDEIPF